MLICANTENERARLKFKIKCIKPIKLNTTWIFNNIHSNEMTHYYRDILSDEDVVLSFSTDHSNAITINNDDKYLYCDYTKFENIENIVIFLVEKENDFKHETNRKSIISIPFIYGFNVNFSFVNNRYIVFQKYTSQFFSYIDNHFTLSVKDKKKEYYKINRLIVSSVLANKYININYPIIFERNALRVTNVIPKTRVFIRIITDNSFNMNFLNHNEMIYKPLNIGEELLLYDDKNNFTIMKIGNDEYKITQEFLDTSSNVQTGYQNTYDDMRLIYQVGSYGQLYYTLNLNLNLNLNHNQNLNHNRN